LDPVTVIVAALVAGAATGATDTATTAVHDAYTALRDALRRRLPGRKTQLDPLLADPDANRQQLTRILEASGSAQDETLIAAAQHLLSLIDPGGVKAGKYVVDLRDAKGVQVGDNNIQINKF
jgi:hypothetical protein